MSNDDEKALDETRDNLRAAGVELTEEGRIAGLSGLLDKIAKDGGGVIDQDTAVDWSLRSRDGEDVIVEVARDVSRFSRNVRETGQGMVSALAVIMFLDHITSHLADGLARFVYGTKPEDLMQALSPLAGLPDEAPEGVVE